jgi:tRNA dimethylallyltransferase
MKTVSPVRTHETTVKGLTRGYNLIVVLGPTASGKTELAVRLARSIDGEIISADSRQVYRGMDLGTGKDLSEYSHGGVHVPFHLIDILDPQEEFSVFVFRRLFYKTFQEIHNRGHVPLLVGGTGLYLDAVIRNYAMPAVPENQTLREALAGEGMESLRRRLLISCTSIHNSTNLLNRARIMRAIEIAEFMKDNPHETGISVSINPVILGIRCQRAILHQRITDRLESRLAAGMIEEVQRLHENGTDWKRIDSFGLEYRYIGLYLQGAMTREAMAHILNVRIRQFAKRQETWFRHMEKNGVLIHWIDSKEEIRAILRNIGPTI